MCSSVSVGTGVTLLALWLGAVGLQEKWQYNRRAQRGIVVGAAAIVMSMWISSAALILQVQAAADPNVSEAMFGTICAAPWGG